MVHLKGDADPIFTHKHFTRLDMPTSDKHSSLLRKSVNYGRKKFYKHGHQASFWGGDNLTAKHSTLTDTDERGQILINLFGHETVFILRNKLVRLSGNLVTWVGS